MWWVIIGGALLCCYMVALFMRPEFNEYRIVKRTYGNGSIEYAVERRCWSGFYGGWTICGEFPTKDAAEEAMRGVIEDDANSTVVKKEIL